tara:strand:+ start:836 stop:1093 length:258 start_codon:yes stop_codon:yes gene_type:complete
MLIKVLAAEGTLSSPSNVGSATVVRLYNSHSGTVVITRKNAGGDTIGSFSAVNGEVVYVEKDSTDTLTAASNASSILVTKIAYAN